MKIKRLTKKIINYLWRWSNTNLSHIMRCTFCGRVGMHLMTSRGRERMHLCPKCEIVFRSDLSSSYWGGLGHFPKKK